MREFAAKFDGREYESEFERTSYLLGTDVFIEAADDGGATYLLLSPKCIAAEEMRGAFVSKSPQEFASITESLEAKYGCKD
nr:hypothetical protein [uncultured Campylobacter sp.]